MSNLFKKVLFGFKPDEVQNEITRLETVNQQKISALQAEVEKAKDEWKKSNEEVKALEAKLENYILREQSIVDIMVLAQKKAQQIEEEAHLQAKAMLESAEKELLQKKQQLEKLQEKLASFKKEFKELLDEYRFSIERVGPMPKEKQHTLMLLENEKLTEKNKETLRRIDS